MENKDYKELYEEIAKAITTGLESYSKHFESANDPLQRARFEGALFVLEALQFSCKSIERHGFKNFMTMLDIIP